MVIFDGSVKAVPRRKIILRRILGKMAPLVDFHDATTLLGDFTMVKNYTIDWEKTVVVYRCV